MSYRETSYLAPRTAARVAREVQDLLKTPETGVLLQVDEATGLPANLQELTVSRRRVRDSKKQRFESGKCRR